MNTTVPILSSIERSNAALIRYPRFKDLHKLIRECQELSKISDEPQCMTLEGKPGAGKSTLVRDYAGAFPREETREGSIIPVFSVETPSPVTVKGLAAKMLEAMGDPAANKGTLWSMNSRLDSFIRECHVELVIMDDFHHLIDRKTMLVLEEVSDWLKVRIKETNVPFLVVGIEGTIEVILQTNPQLSRLFAARETLRPFIWDPAHNKTIGEFSRFVQYAEEATEMSLPSSPNRSEMLFRLHYATDGIVGNLMNLLRKASLLARANGSKELSLPLLSQAFQFRLAKHLPSKVDPFSFDPRSKFIPENSVSTKNSQSVFVRSLGRRRRFPSVMETLVAN
jgi:energy-coupling factor transporter ATP-binding protein EcfA2